MNDLFADNITSKKAEHSPLADRIRPGSIGLVAGQGHLISDGAPLRAFIETSSFPSMIFWGPPGSGKTTLAMIIAGIADYHFEKLSAVDSGVKEVRQIILNAGRILKSGRKTLVFIDEIHRFNKSQQDSLLNAVEKGIITLIGATTENPSFEVNSALLSRCQVYKLQPLENADIRKIIEYAISNDVVLSKLKIMIDDWDFFYAISGGDARTALNALELAVKIAKRGNDGKIVIGREALERALQQKTAFYDKKGDSHYDTISAFIKSLRGSDPDAALLWLAKMLDAGEEPRFIARRMVVFASEDIGNADPFALTLSISVFQAVEMIGMPECRINLAQGVAYLASAPKSNSSYIGIEKALEKVKSGASLITPLHLRNAPTRLMKQEGYAEGYKYPHEFEEHFVEENYFPLNTKPEVFYNPGVLGREKSIRERLVNLWKKRY